MVIVYLCSFQSVSLHRSTVRVFHISLRRLHYVCRSDSSSLVLCRGSWTFLEGIRLVSRFQVGYVRSCTAPSRVRSPYHAIYSVLFRDLSVFRLLQGYYVPLVPHWFHMVNRAVPTSFTCVTVYNIFNCILNVLYRSLNAFRISVIGQTTMRRSKNHTENYGPVNFLPFILLGVDFLLVTSYMPDSL